MTALEGQEEDCKRLEQKQREALVNIKAAEKKHLHSVASWLVPVVEQELGLMTALEGLGGVLQQLEKPSNDETGISHFEETMLEENGMGSRSTSISSLTSMVSLMAPISPSPLFNRREERESSSNKPLRSRSASICDLVSNFSKSSPDPLVIEDSKESVDSGNNATTGDRARGMEIGRPRSFSTVRRSCSPFPHRGPPPPPPRLHVMQESPGEGNSEEDVEKVDKERAVKVGR